MHHKSEEDLGEALMSASSSRTLTSPSPWFTRSKQPSGTSGSHDFWWWEIPGLTASPSLRHLTSICLPSLCDSDSPAVWTLLSYATRELTQWFWCGGWWTQKFCTCMALSPMSTMEIMPDLYLCRDAEEVGKEEQAELRKAMTKGKMSGWMNHTSSSARILIWCCTGASCHWGLIWNSHCSAH